MVGASRRLARLVVPYGRPGGSSLPEKEYMLRIFHIGSIRRRLLLAILLTSTAAVLITVTVIVAYEHVRIREATKTRLYAETELIARATDDALASGDIATAKEVLSALWMRRGAISACLHTPDGKLFATYDLQNSFEPPPPAPGDVKFGSEYAQLCRPVMRDNKLVGFVTMRSEIQQQVRELRRLAGIALATIAGALVVALVLSFQLRQFISAPLLALTRAARAVAQQDYSVRVTKRSRDETGELTDAFNQMLDTIARREADLAASEERYRLLVESAPEGIMVVANGLVAFINENGAKMLGARAAAELIGRAAMEFVHPDFHEQVCKRTERLTQERQVVPLLEKRYVRLDGSVFDVEVNAQPVLHQGQEAIRVFFRDITERKKAEEALAQSRRFIEHIAETMPDVVCVHDLVSRRNVYINRAVQRILGLTPEQFLAEPTGHFVHPDDALRLAAHSASVAAARDGEIVETTCRFRDTDGHWHLLELRDTVFTRLPDGTVQQVIGVATDVTAHRELEQEVLAISERERARIGQDVHDGLCQQLVGVTFVVKLLREKLKGKNMAESADLEEIEDLVREAITEAREISHALYPERFLEGGLCVALQNLAAQTSKRYSVQCVTDCPDIALPIDDHAALHLYRIVQEAVTNAVKHANPSRIHISLSVDGGLLRLTVQDDGIGIAEKADQNGGLGLRIMQYRAHMIGGSLEVRPAEGGGTLITCRCPGSGETGVEEAII